MKKLLPLLLALCLLAGCSSGPTDAEKPQPTEEPEQITWETATSTDGTVTASFPAEPRENESRNAGDYQEKSWACMYGNYAFVFVEQTYRPEIAKALDKDNLEALIEKYKQDFEGFLSGEIMDFQGVRGVEFAYRTGTNTFLKQRVFFKGDTLYLYGYVYTDAAGTATGPVEDEITSRFWNALSVK